MLRGTLVEICRGAELHEKPVSSRMLEVSGSPGLRTDPKLPSDAQPTEFVQLKTQVRIEVASVWYPPEGFFCG